MMWDQNIGAIVVTDNHERPLAVITDRDVCMAALTQGRALDAPLVSSAMSRTLYTCHVGDRVTAAERTMRTHTVRRLPVVDDDFRLVGILALSDLVRARMLLADRAESRRLLAEVALTLGDICRPAGTLPPSHIYGSLMNATMDEMDEKDEKPAKPARTPASAKLSSSRAALKLGDGQGQAAHDQRSSR
jgi:CBS-domain-containing membrane protein